MQLRRCCLVMLIGLLLQSCASPQMNHDLKQGKLTFEAGEYQSAFHQLLPLAVEGNKEAQYAIGYMYYYGYGVAQDMESGIFWMNKSADQRYKPARTALDIINQRTYQSDPYLSPRAALQPPVQSPSTPIQAKQIQPVAQLQPASQLPTVIQQTAEASIPAKDPVLQALSAEPQPAAPKKLASLSERHYPAFQVKTKPHVSAASVVVAETEQPFALQLFGTYHLDEAEKLKSQLSLAHLSIHKTKHNDKDWYVLTYGHYQNAHDAVLAKNALPMKMQKMGAWVRDVDSLKAIG